MFYFERLGWTYNPYLTKKSGFLKYLIYGDKVIVDRGFSIAKSAGTYGTRLEIPRFTKSSLEQRKLKI